MIIQRVIATKTDIEVSILELFTNFFGIDTAFTKRIYDDGLKGHIDQLIDDVSFFIEAPYIDKVYRDSYYHYFSSKLGNYKKDCIRISVFKGTITEESFRDVGQTKSLRENYLGFLILRPTTPNIIGRSVISPKAVKHSGFLAVMATVGATANALKFEVEGFPHSSQDMETITCAETSVWAIMEYFGYKYAEYKPVLPSRIIKALRNISAERQIPSKGLNIQQMAFALKEFGFATRIYGKDDFGDEFKKLFSVYIESGIPVIIAVDNRHHHPGGNIGHALLAIGHETIDDNAIDSLLVSKETDNFINEEIGQKKIQFYDHDDIKKKYVFVDDNMPTYSMNDFNTPATHYPDKDWHNCEITYFIVPLHPKIYLEAFEAKNFSKQILLSKFKIPPGTEIYFRYFLTSSRSYKHYVALESNMQADIREMIIETQMPKFIWIAEISEKMLIKQRKAKGFVIIDATEANILGVKPLIVTVYNGEMLTMDPASGNISRISLPSPNFSIFTNNLKGF
jgi:hypothetical protein